jgi:membrane protein
MGYVDFTGRSTRSDYWLAVLANTIVSIILFTVIIVVIVFDSPGSDYHVIPNLLYGLAMVYFFATYIPSIALQVRRLRDAGFHWALIFLRFASVIGDIVLLVLSCQPTKVEFPFNQFNNSQQ